MCWLSDNNKIRIAKRPIKVFKIVRTPNYLGLITPAFYPDKEIYGYSHECRYIPDKKTFTAPLVMCGASGKYICFEAFHSYSRRLTIDREDAICYVNRMAYIASIHLYAKCVIPKGSKYAVNKAGEYVSDQIKFIKFKPLKATSLVRKLFIKYFY